jgi:hypothetical protein
VIGNTVAQEAGLRLTVQAVGKCNENTEKLRTNQATVTLDPINTNPYLLCNKTSYGCYSKMMSFQKLKKRDTLPMMSNLCPHL